jgi:hypothetical protein
MTPSKPGKVLSCLPLFPIGSFGADASLRDADET